jgi:hypothetical protein
MQRTTRIEARPARRTDCLAIQVLTDGQFGPASAAEHRLLVEFSPGPNPGGMTGFQLVTVKAGIIGPAAVEFDRDDIELAAIMCATRTPIQLDASYRDSPNRKFHINYLRISPQVVSTLVTLASSAITADSPCSCTLRFGRW